MKIINSEQQEELKKQFDEKRAIFSEQKYFSKLNESTRIVKIIRAKYLKQSINDVFKILVSMLAKDLHVDLNYEDLKNDYFYRSGKKDKKQYMHLAHFEENKEVTVEWFTDESWIVKNFYFSSKFKKKFTKITYLVVIKGLEPSVGYLPKIMQNRYIKAENIRFDMQMLTLCHKLNLLKFTEEKYRYKLTQLSLKLSKIQNFVK